MSAVNAKRSAPEQARHDLAVRRICRACFSNRARWDVFSNPGDAQRYALVLPEERRLYPDIVVCRKGDPSSAYLVAVETENSICDEKAEQWQELAALGKRFLLFIPAGTLLAARELCQRRRIPVFGYRVYELTPFWIRIRDIPG